MNNIFGEYLRSKRTEKGYGTRQLAGLLGVSPGYLSQVETGQSKPPTVDRLQRIAFILGLDQDQFVVLAGRMPHDVHFIITTSPKEVLELIRETVGMERKHVKRLTALARKLKADAKPNHR